MSGAPRTQVTWSLQRPITCLEAWQLGYTWLNTCSNCISFEKEAPDHSRIAKKSRDELVVAWQCSSMHEIKDLSMASFISPPSSNAVPFHKRQWQSHWGYFVNDQGTSFTVSIKNDGKEKKWQLKGKNEGRERGKERHWQKRKQNCSLF